MITKDTKLGSRFPSGDLLPDFNEGFKTSQDIGPYHVRNCVNGLCSHPILMMDISALELYFLIVITNVLVDLVGFKGTDVCKISYRCNSMVKAKFFKVLFCVYGFYS